MEQERAWYALLCLTNKRSPSECVGLLQSHLTGIPSRLKLRPEPRPELVEGLVEGRSGSRIGGSEKEEGLTNQRPKLTQPPTNVSPYQ
jgi:hypothetical protein